MTYSARTRDRFRLAVAAVTGVTTVAALSAAGWLAGAAAHDSEELQQEQAAVAQAKYRSDLAAWRKAGAVNACTQQQRPGVELRDRPHRTETTVRYVHLTGTSAVGAGGQVTAAPPAGQQQSPPPSTAPAPPPPAPAPAPVAAPVPAPVPAPSSGS